MLILGTYRVWKEVPIEFITDEDKAAGKMPATVRLFLNAMTEPERAAIIGDIAHLEESDKAEWQRQLLIRFGQKTIKDWMGVGSCDEDGKVHTLPVTQENVAAFMEKVGLMVLPIINDVNRGLDTSLDEAGNG
jgi:hypothetical protein